jgi:hypothetical protein
VSILDFFDLRKSFGNAIIDNASKNAAYIDLLRDKLFINTSKRYVRYIGYVINLIV